MRILKFGGTSLENAEKFIQVANILENNMKKEEQIAIVLSAPAKITNHLIETIKCITHGNHPKKYITSIESIFFKLLTNINHLENNFFYQALKKVITKEIRILKKMFNGIYLINYCPEKIYAKIISKGEIVSINIMKYLLKTRNYKITIINPIKKLIATGNYLDSSVDIVTSTKLIFSMKIPKKHIILMPGFIAGNMKGELVLLGRNGSDYSAAILAACLKATCCEIWTDVDGVYTADPKEVTNAKLLNSLSYQEAIELSYFGAKVLHPKTILPLIQFNIPCLIKNTNNIKSKGTLISNNHINTNYLIKGITCLKNISMFNILGPKMKGTVDIVKRTFSSISKTGKKIILIIQSSSKHSINFCVEKIDELKVRNALKEEFRLELQNKLLEKINVLDQLAIISIIGDGINTQHKTISKIFSGLAESRINVIAISKDSSTSSISIVIKNEDIKSGIQIIHQVTFDNKKIIEIFLIGVGGVGQAFLKQLHQQQEKLYSKNIYLKICGIANTKNLLTNITHGIDLHDWKQKLINSNTSWSLNHFVKFIKSSNLLHPIIVDCTANQTIALQYTNFLLNGCHVVAANKQANTSNFDFYKKIRNITTKTNKKFLYETNVGAGLPVIENLKNLLNSGDELIHFRGILSGSLSFIFGKLDDDISLSDATVEAMKIGFTEPDPRDDLSGIDVARKLLILAREVGYKIELHDIEIEPLLPNYFKNITNINDIIKNLKKLDKLFSLRISEARALGKVLRYIGTIDKNGKCKVKIAEIDFNDPLYTVKNGENALAFYSKYYQPTPLVLRGYGAGNDVTAAGIFSDVLRTIP